MKFELRTEFYFADDMVITITNIEVTLIIKRHIHRVIERNGGSHDALLFQACGASRQIDGNWAASDGVYASIGATDAAHVVPAKVCKTQTPIVII